MFVRVNRKNIGLHFTVVDILSVSDESEQELDLILDLGVIQPAHLKNEQSWYVIAENLLASELPERDKRLLAKDIANWLPPLSREVLLETRADDIKQLGKLYPATSPLCSALPAELNEKDPLTIIAGWLADK